MNDLLMQVNKGKTGEFAVDRRHPSQVSFQSYDFSLNKGSKHPSISDTSLLMRREENRDQKELGD
jgi:hypothetical protein